MNTMRPPKRLPNEAGVTFEGFETTRIPSREIVGKKIENWLESCTKMRAPSMRVLLGEWGEGKTDAYRRHIAPWCKRYNHKAFFVSSSTLANTYDSPQAKEAISNTSLSSLRFLVALFSATKSTSPELPFPSVNGYSDSFQFVRDCLKAVCQGDSRLIFFIDEFEELLGRVRLSEVISGLKEILNPPQIPSESKKSLSPESLLHESGEFQGRVHFMLSCTPDAFFRLQADGDTSLIFGGLGRRVGQIEITQISKGEAARFLDELMRYSYEGKLDFLPVESAGIFSSLARVGQSNPGVMVSLFAHFFQSLRVSQEEMRIADHTALLEFLQSERVFVYGGQTRCLEPETLDRLFRIVGHSGSEKGPLILLRLLLGSLGPISQENVRTCIHLSDGDFKSSIGLINERLRREEGIQHAVLKVKALKEGLNFTDLVQALSKFVAKEEDRSILKMGNYEEPLAAVEDRLTWYDYGEDRILKSRVCVPADLDSALAIFEGIAPEDAIEFAKIVERRCSEGPSEVLASEQLLQRVFPTPVPTGLEYIHNRETRAKLWREVNRNLSDLYNENMPNAVVDLIGMIDDNEVSVLRKGPDFVLTLLSFSGGARIVTLFYSANGDLEAGHVDRLYELAKGSSPILHLAIVLYSGEMSKEAASCRKAKELGEAGSDSTLYIRIHPAIAKRVIIDSVLCRSYKECIESQLYNSAIENLVNKELTIPQKVETWLKRQAMGGKVIDDLRTQFPPRELADSLKFYLNLRGSDATPDTALARNRDELLKFVFYSSRLGLIPDISGLEKFKSMTEDLVEAGFLAYRPKSGALYVLQHPIEKRIIEILGSTKGMPENQLEEHFILASRSRKLLRNVYLNLLEYEGVVHEKNTLFALRDKTELAREAETSLEELRRQIDSKRLGGYCHVFVRKERESRLIMPKEALDIAISLSAPVRSPDSTTDDLLTRQKASLALSLSRHMLDEILPHVRGAVKIAEDNILSIEKSVSDFEERLTNLCSNLRRWFKIEVEPENVDEFVEISGLKDRAVSIHHGYSDLQNLRKLEKGLKESELSCFLFNKSDDESFGFNLKTKRIVEINEDVQSKLVNYLKVLTLAEENLRRLDDSVKRIREKADAIGNPPYPLLTSEVLKRLKSLDVYAGIQLEKRRKIGLQDVKRYCENVTGKILTGLDGYHSCVVHLSTINGFENSLSAALAQAGESVKWAEEILDVEPWKSGTLSLRERLDARQEEYDGLKTKIVSEDPKEILEVLRIFEKELPVLEQDLKAISGRVNEIWTDYRSEIDEFVASIRRLVSLTRKRQTLASGDALEKELESLDKVLSRTKPLELRSPISKYDPSMQRSRRLMYSLVAPVLTKDEASVLGIVLGHLKEDSNRWLPLSDLHSELEKKLALSPDQVDSVFRGLIKKRFLKGGVALIP